MGTFGKIMSSALEATGGQAMKWIGELCEPPFDEKRFSRDLQKAISQSLNETPSAFKQASNTNVGMRGVKRGIGQRSELVEKKPVACDPNAVRPRAKFVEQYALSTLDQQQVTLSAVLPGEKVTQIWRMVNPSEDQDWPPGVYAKSVGGDDFVIQTSKWTPSTVVSPKKEIDIVVDAIAPEKPGRYIHYWRLNDFKTGNQCSQSELNARVVKKVSTCVAKEELKKDVDVSESTAAEATESPPLGVIEEKDDKDNNAKPAEIEDGKEKEQQDDISDILSNTSSSLSHPDEQWDLLHSNNFVDDFVTSSKSMVQVEKFKKQLDLLSSMGSSNRDTLIKLLEKHNGDVQKVIDSFVTSA